MITDASCLAGLRVAIVEDETMIAMEIEDVLLDRGCVVIGIAGTLDDAFELIAREQPDAVTLDGNLAGTLSGPIARHLGERGIPYLVITGYVELTSADPWLAAAPKLQKPFTVPGLTRAAAQYLC